MNLKSFVRAVLFGLIFTAFGPSVWALPKIERSGSGCPDNFCVWAVGYDFGQNPTLNIYDPKGRLLSSYSRNQVNFSVNEKNQDVISAQLNTRTEIDAYGSQYLYLQVINNENLQTSALFKSKRSNSHGTFQALPNRVAQVPLVAGGTNYVFYDLGQYVQDREKWGDPEHGVKMVIPWYHLASDRINEQIRRIAESGQKQISLVLWWVNYPEAPDGVYMHTVDISFGLRPQHKQNLAAILEQIKQYSFDTVVMRFAPQGGMDPSGWQQWHEDRYQLAWTAVKQAHALVEQSLRGSSIQALYDLSVEMGGLEQPQQINYQKKLWSDYVDTYGSSATSGFSIAYYPGRLEKMVQIMDSTGRGRPSFYAVDMYERPRMEGGLYRFALELDRIGDYNKAILLQETWYNDAVTYHDVLAARNEYGLNIWSIHQWMLSQHGVANGAVHFDVTDASQYENYLFPSPNLFFELFSKLRTFFKIK